MINALLHSSSLPSVQISSLYENMQEAEEPLKIISFQCAEKKDSRNEADK